MGHVRGQVLPRQSTLQIILVLSCVFLNYASANTCQVKKTKNYYLKLGTAALWKEATGGKKVGKCYIIPKSKKGPCDIYVKSGIVGADGDTGWPKTVTRRGNGCVKAPFHPKAVTTCYYKRPAYKIPPALIKIFCTNDGKKNAAAILKHAISKNACKLLPNQNPQPCKPPAPGCVCSAKQPQCPKPGKPFPYPVKVQLDTIRRCRIPITPVLCNSVVTRPEYEVFGRYGMSRTNQKKVFISQVNTPPRQKTRNAVIAIAGQQGSVWLDAANGDASGITGQQRGYRSGFSTKTGTLVKSISRSLAKEIMQTGYFSKANTFVGLVFDARFNYEYKADVKNSHAKGYLSYILERLGNNVGTIYLAGHSRGGCLALRLAQELTIKMPKARVIVHSYDPVCTVLVPGLVWKNEFGVQLLPRRKNLFRKGYWTYTTNMKSRFKNRRCLSIANFLSGGQALDAGHEVASSFLSYIRAFGHREFFRSRNAVDSLLIGGRPWYTERIFSTSHDAISFAHHSTAAVLFRKAMNDIPCDCGSQ